MEIQQKIKDVFTVKDVVNKPIDTNSQIELKTIENQLNIHLKNKQGLKFKKVSITHDKSYNSETFTEVIDEELRNKIVNKKWKGLPMFMKWNLITEFVKLDPTLDINDIKEKFVNNLLQVDYENNKITKIFT